MLRRTATRVSLVIAALWMGLACSDAVGPRMADPRLPPDSRVVAVATGFSSSCALTELGRMYCWGENRFGELGDSTRQSRSTPARVHSDSVFVAITGTQGTSRSCAITPSGTGYCWGYNLNGELGDGSTTDRYVPTEVSGGIRFAQISTSYHTCGLDIAGLAHCWPYGDVTVPTPVVTPVQFTTITIGLEFTCGLDTAGRAYCWGWGAMVGAGGSPDRIYDTPVPVATTQRFVSLSAAEEHTCAVTKDGAAFCWGKVRGAFDSVSTTPVRIVNLPGVKLAFGAPIGDVPKVRQVVGGRLSSCVLMVDGRAFCGSLGDSLAVVADSIRFSGLSVGNGYACGFTAGGAAFCWGQNWAGQLGDPDVQVFNTELTPVRVRIPTTP